MKKARYIFLIFLLASPCHAFKPAEQHEPISKQALSYYQKCTGQTIPEEYSGEFIDGVVSEDDVTMERLLNWHFYNNRNRIGTYYLLFYGANDKIFQKLLLRLESLLDSDAPRPEAIYKIAGRLAHHIQDMSAPAHVIPVYHVGDDKFDHYMPITSSDENISEYCRALNEPVKTPRAIFEQAAQNTLKDVQAPVAFESGKTFENETWMKFWGGPDDKDLEGFKTYGVYGNVFGVMPPCKSTACRLYGKETYDRFFNACHKKAIMDTMQLILHINQSGRRLRNH